MNVLIYKHSPNKQNPLYGKIEQIDYEFSEVRVSGSPDLLNFDSIEEIEGYYNQDKFERGFPLDLSDYILAPVMVNVLPSVDAAKNFINLHWQPIETAPKDGTSILLYSDTYTEWAIGKYSELGFWYLSVVEEVTAPGEEDTYGLNPTHWMPLPEPPK